MRVIADPGIKSTIEGIFHSLKDKDVLVVYLERADEFGHRNKSPGLDDVIEAGPTGKPITMLGWMSPIMANYADNPRWHAAMGYPNVAFCRLPGNLAEILVALEEATEAKRHADPLAIALLTTAAIEHEKGILLHDLYYAERDTERMVTWLMSARKCLGDRSETDLIQAVKEGGDLKEIHPQFAGQTFPDVCVDCEGTLFINDGVFRPDVLDFAMQLANGRPMTIWTGGHLKTARAMVRKAGIPYKLIPKQLLRGATVGAVVDDLPEAVFGKKYGIRYGTYHRV